MQQKALWFTYITLSSVNEIFDPYRVDKVYAQNPIHRARTINLDRGTNYGVVRLELLEHLYENLYIQRVQRPDPMHWKFRILTQRYVRSSCISATKPMENAKINGSGKPSSSEMIELELVYTDDAPRAGHVDKMKFDAVFVATGYVRNAHEEMLSETTTLLPSSLSPKDDTTTTLTSKFPVSRNYRVQYDASKVDGNAGVWLQGCNEKTHGLSDTLLSILAIRSGELVESIFGGVEEVDM